MLYYSFPPNIRRCLSPLSKSVRGVFDALWDLKVAGPKKRFF